MIYCFIISSNSNYVKVLTEYIEKAFGVILLGVNNDIKESLNIIRTFYTKPNFTFIESDIATKGDLQLVSLFQELSEIILISANKEAAYVAYEVGAYDFILLPSNYNRFLKSITKKIKADDIFGRGYFFIKLETKSKLHKIEFDDLLYIEALHNYSKIYTRSGCFVTYVTLKALEESLPKSRFVRVHRSFIINIKHLQNVDGTVLELSDNINLPIGSKYIEFFLYTIGDSIL